MFKNARGKNVRQKRHLVAAEDTGQLQNSADSSGTYHVQTLARKEEFKEAWAQNTLPKSPMVLDPSMKKKKDIGDE